MSDNNEIQKRMNENFINTAYRERIGDVHQAIERALDVENVVNSLRLEERSEDGMKLFRAKCAMNGWDTPEMARVKTFMKRLQEKSNRVLANDDEKKSDKKFAQSMLNLIEAFEIETGIQIEGE